MNRKFFGTDGIRGTANSGNMTAEIAMKLGMAAGSIFTRGNHRHCVVIGKDTRLSGYLLEPALTAGFISVGMDVILVGPMPTPAVAMLTRSLRADIGVMISASHNPYYDNGIKLFSPDGFKISDEVELDIESRIMDPAINSYLSTPDHLGKARRLEDAAGRYIEFAKNTFPKRLTLEGLKIVIDCANGAAYHLGKTILWELGAEVICIGNSPNGFNINENCGSNHPQTLIEEVKKNQADLGIALDGDADRLVLVDEKGQIIDGDQIMALITNYYYSQNLLRGKAIVATVMSNLRLEQYLQNLGLSLVRTAVGDRYVVEAMRNYGINIGGEQSGHIILSDYTTTGDGLIAALHVLAVICQNNKPVSEVCRVFDPFPQIMKNTYVNDPSILQSEKIQKFIKNAETKLKRNGRLLVRKSGTEPLIRVMAEGEDKELVNKIVDEIIEAIRLG